ncbi:cytochrome P450 4g15-like [Sitodiplosis mosellana]|uniref:cytochrome P450 4g15-like n=1 Tax=Sitodiplosis mosellana TaxID=263140 RepID=UPI002444ACDE|nr:cytochrome P450 4g15-like [Sitodiplosis mosellana]
MGLDVEHLAGETVRSAGGYTFPLILPLIFVTISLALLHVYLQSRRIAKIGNKIPGPPTLPLIGNAHYVWSKTHNEILELALELSKVYTNLARIWIGPKLIVFLTHPKDVEIILGSHVHIDKSDEYRFFKPWLGNGLLISSGEHWRSHRKLIAPAFHQNVLKSFIPTFNSNSLNVVKRLQKEVGKVFDIHDYMSETTVDILLETAMGHKRIGKDDDGFKYAMAVMKMCDILHARHVKVYLRFDALFNMTKIKEKQEQLLNTIHGLTKRVIKEKKKLFEDNYKEGNVPTPSLSEIIANDYVVPLKPEKKTAEGLRDDLDDIDENDVGEKRRLAFLDLMIESAKNGANLSDTDIKEEVDTIMFEGHDTTAAGSSFVLCLLGIHQDIQDRVYKEIYQIFGDSDREATFNDTMEMKYLERVIMESLRLYPPVPMIARKVNQDIQLASEDYIVPAGATVVIGTYKIHRRPDIYPNPDRFDPDNFLPERTQYRHYYSFIPFSAGPRSCVGRKYAMLKLKVLLSTILRNYRIKSSLTQDDFKLQADIILKRTDGFRIEVEPRKRVVA